MNKLILYYSGAPKNFWSDISIKSTDDYGALCVDLWEWCNWNCVIKITFFYNYKIVNLLLFINYFWHMYARVLRYNFIFITRAITPSWVETRVPVLFITCVIVTSSFDMQVQEFFIQMLANRLFPKWRSISVHFQNLMLL